MGYRSFTSSIMISYILSSGPGEFPILLELNDITTEKKVELRELLAFEGSCCFSTQRNESYSVISYLLKKKLAWLVKLDEQVIKIGSIPFNNCK